MHRQDPPSPVPLDGGTAQEARPHQPGSRAGLLLASQPGGGGLSLHARIRVTPWMGLADRLKEKGSLLGFVLPFKIITFAVVERTGWSGVRRLCRDELGDSCESKQEMMATGWI